MCNSSKCLSLSKVETELFSVLCKAAKSLNIEDYLSELNTTPCNINEGIMSDIYFVVINNVNAKRKTSLVIKKAPFEKVHRELRCIEQAYKNEIHFYYITSHKVKQFDRELSIGLSMSIATYVTSISEKGNEMIVLTNLRAEGYKMFNELHRPLDGDLMHLIFETYGRFHAASFCLKSEDPEHFKNLMAPLENIWEVKVKSDKFVNEYKVLMQNCIDMLNDCDHYPIKEKLLKYLEDFKLYFLSTIIYQGDYGCLLHGDCCLSNMMFRVNNGTGEIDDIRLIGFQQARFGSPIHDLSYFLFIEGSMHLDISASLLQIYTESFFSAIQHKFNKDPTKLFPIEEFRNDWKIYTKSSMMLAILLLKVKFVNKQEILRQKEMLRSFPEVTRHEKLTSIPHNIHLFFEKMESILVYMLELDIL